jgi:hypothetical protein
LGGIGEGGGGRSGGEGLQHLVKYQSNKIYSIDSIIVKFVQKGDRKNINLFILSNIPGYTTSVER